MKKILLLIVLLFTTPAFADEEGNSVYFLMSSYHWDTSIPYNESHDEIGFEHNSGFFVETFNNSKYIRTYYVGYIKRDLFGCLGDVCFGGDIGAIKGYDYCGEVWCTGIFPAISYKYKHIGADIRFGAGEVVALRLRYEF